MVLLVQEDKVHISSPTQENVSLRMPYLGLPGGPLTLITSCLISLSLTAVPQLSNHSCSNALCTNAENQYCFCDKYCAAFGDCCIDVNSTVVLSDQMSAPLKRECLSAVIHYDATELYPMVTSCKTTFHCFEKNLCETKRKSFPPVTDITLGIIYKNKYCALCNNITLSKFRLWNTVKLCEHGEMGNEIRNISYKLSSKGNCTWKFMSPENVTVPQKCIPHWLTPIDICPDRPTWLERNGSSKEWNDYNKLRKQCLSEPFNLTTVEDEVYKNAYCLFCNKEPSTWPKLAPRCFLETSLEIWRETNVTNSIMPPNVSFEPPMLDCGIDISIADVLDLTGTITYPETFINSTCEEGYIYDVFMDTCIKDLCQLGYAKGDEDCRVNCSLIALSKTEYRNVSNDLIYWIAAGRNTTATSIEEDGSAVICTNFTRYYSKMVTGGSREVGVETILTILGFSIDILSCIFVLLTYSIFGKLRTFYSKLLMNYTTAVLLGDVFFLFGNLAYYYTQSTILCSVMAIVLHYLFLTRFVWTNLLSFNICKGFYNVSKMIIADPNERLWGRLAAYVVIGWAPSLLVLLITVAVNFAQPGTVGYGMNGRCWITEPIALGIAFILPLALSLFFNIILFIISLSLLLQSMHNKTVDKKKRGHVFKNFRVIVAIFIITGLTWVFGFLPLMDNSLSWSWYLFIVFNTTQGLSIAIAYLCTKKVARLYKKKLIKLRKAFLCARSKRPKRKAVTTPQTTENQLHETAV